MENLSEVSTGPSVNSTVTGQDCIFDKENYVKYFSQGLSICTKPDGYKTLVFSAGPNKTKYYCRVITNAPKGVEVDHIDGNTLNNHIDNLRLVTSQQNKFNTKKRGNSGLPKGVVRHGTSFKATLTSNYQTYYLGTFPTVEQAAEAYRKKAEEKFGLHAFHNSRK